MYPREIPRVKDSTTAIPARPAHVHGGQQRHSHVLDDDHTLGHIQSNVFHTTFTLRIVYAVECLCDTKWSVPHRNSCRNEQRCSCVRTRMFSMHGECSCNFVGTVYNTGHICLFEWLKVRTVYFYLVLSFSYYLQTITIHGINGLN